MPSLTRQQFFDILAPQAIQARREGSPLFPSVRLAQNLLETGGKINQYNNLGGFKATGSPNEWWKGETYTTPTWEVTGGKRVQTVATWRVYASVHDFYRDQDRLFQSDRYARVRAANTPEDQATALFQCGYATDAPKEVDGDPAYHEKIITIIKAYGLTKYDEEVTIVPTIYKERIVAVNGKLKYIPLNGPKPYSTKATDVRLIRIAAGRTQYRFVYEKGAKVSQLVKKYGANIGINFPFFYNGMPLGDAEDHDKTIAAASGKMLTWHELAARAGEIYIGQLDKREPWDFLVQASPLLVENGKPVWAKYAAAEQTADDIRYGRAQRTFVGKCANGDFLIAVADGRTSLDLGLTLEEAALYMIDKGATVALNGDGGGSSIMVTSFGGKYEPSKLAFKAGALNQALNTGANERPVHHALLVYLK